jgi:hypothetical protein
MIIVMVDDEPYRVDKYIRSLRDEFGHDKVLFRESIAHLQEFMRTLEADGRLEELCLVLDIMFGEDGNTDGLDRMLLDVVWGPHIVRLDIPVLVLTNKKKDEVMAAVRSVEFEFPVGSGTKIKYNISRLDVRRKLETKPEDLPLIAQRLFKKDRI